MMNKFTKIVGSIIIGALAGWLVWLLIYLSHKTPAIEFDGPAGLVMILATLTGALVFGLVGVIFAIRKKF